MQSKNTKIIILYLNAFKNIFKKTIAENDLKAPEHFDLMIDTYLSSQIITFFPKAFDIVSKKELIDYLYTSNIQKIKMANLDQEAFRENYPFGVFYEDFLIEKIIKDYNAIKNNELLAKELIKNTIDLNISEILSVNKSFKNFKPGLTKVEVPVNFFINCFVHPIILFKDRDFIIYEHKEEIDNICNLLYVELAKKFSIFVNESLNFNS